MAHYLFTRLIHQSGLCALWLWHELLNIIFPRGCLVCHAPIVGSLSLCAQCWQHIKWVQGPLCLQCGRDIPFAVMGYERCPSCCVSPPPYDYCRSAVYYETVTRDLILRLKYGDRPEIAYMIARWLERSFAVLAPGLEDAPSRAQNYVVIPVPLHRLRRWRRRYNQSALIALAFAEQLGFPCLLNALMRRKNTRPQVGLSIRERRLNMRGAFRVSDDGAQRIAGRSVILIDDVKTTGATLFACAKLCRKAGADEIIVLSVARVRE